MLVLKKIKASTLMETMVATVLIVVLFMISSLIINSLIAAQSKSNLEPIKERMHVLEYGFQNQTLSIPYYEDWNGWEITGEMEVVNGMNQIRLDALHPENQQSLTTTFIAYDIR
ncbi:MAG: hypothetical protein AAF600_18755 [Bacteroidota bacterium]